jgi:hypothetical protein
VTKKISKVRAKKLARAKLEALMTANGGYSKAALQSLGVSWPPQKGWKEKLIAEMAGLPYRAPAHRSGPIKNGSRKRKKSDGFYASWEWKKLRYEALQLHGNRCQCCGWRPGDTEHGRLVVDHIKPRRKYPELELELSNLQCLCNDCNMGKSDIHEDDFRDLEDWFSSLMRDH